MGLLKFVLALPGFAGFFLFPAVLGRHKPREVEVRLGPGYIAFEGATAYECAPDGLPKGAGIPRGGTIFKGTEHSERLKNSAQILDFEIPWSVAEIDAAKQLVIDKNQLPPDDVWARTGSPRLVLVTCGGRYDASRRGYDDNVVLLNDQSLVDVSNVVILSGYALTCLSVIVLRVRRPAAERRYRAPAAVPLLAFFSAAALLISARPGADQWRFAAILLLLGFAFRFLTGLARRQPGTHP